MNNKKTKLFDVSWFGRNFFATSFFIFIFELLSFVNHFLLTHGITTNTFVIVLLAFLALIVFKKPEISALIALAELIIGSQGHSFDLILSGQTISLRMILFALVLLVFCTRNLKDKTSYFLLHIKKNKLLLLLALFCFWGFVMALYQKYNFETIFNDLNAWLYWLYLIPFIYYFREKRYFAIIWPVLAAASSFVALKSLFYLFVFSHKLNTLQLYLYDWGRDTRWGEFTLAGGGLYRIFAQAQIYSLITVCIFLGYLFFKGRLGYEIKSNRWLIVPLSLGLANDLI